MPDYEKPTTYRLADGTIGTLLVGHRYRIIHRSGTQRVDRASVMDFIGDIDSEHAGVSLLFSARPIAGTQTMPLGWIKSIEEREKTAAIELNRKAD